MDGYLLGPGKLAELDQLIDAGVGGGRPAAVPAGGRQVCYVRVSGPAAGGWHPGVVRTHESPAAFTDHPGAVEVREANGDTLDAGTVYLSVRQGPSPAGTPRYVAAKGGGYRPETVVTGVACVGGELAVTTKTIKVLT